MKNKLIFNGKEYELIETEHPRFNVFDIEKNYIDIGYTRDFLYADVDRYRYECFSIRIKDKFYALKLIENII